VRHGERVAAFNLSGELTMEYRGEARKVVRRRPGGALSRVRVRDSENGSRTRHDEGCHDLGQPHAPA
jgi:hypothetical protein